MDDVLQHQWQMYVRLKGKNTTARQQQVLVHNVRTLHTGQTRRSAWVPLLYNCHRRSNMLLPCTERLETRPLKGSARQPDLRVQYTAADLWLRRPFYHALIMDCARIIARVSLGMHAHSTFSVPPQVQLCRSRAEASGSFTQAIVFKAIVLIQAPDCSNCTPATQQH